MEFGNAVSGDRRAQPRPRAESYLGWGGCCEGAAGRRNWRCAARMEEGAPWDDKRSPSEGTPLVLSR